MDGNTYQILAMRTNDNHNIDRLIKSIDEPKYTTGDLLNGVLGLTGEAGEVADLVKKGIFHEKGIDIEHLKRECGDVLWYLATICDSVGITLNEVMQTNVDKLIARYPNGFDTYLANHRREGDV